jgi:hypothetical protein
VRSKPFDGNALSQIQGEFINVARYTGTATIDADDAPYTTGTLLSRVTNTPSSSERVIIGAAQACGEGSGSSSNSNGGSGGGHIGSGIGSGAGAWNGSEARNTITTSSGADMILFKLMDGKRQGRSFKKCF